MVITGNSDINDGIGHIPIKISGSLSHGYSLWVFYIIYDNKGIHNRNNYEKEEN